MCQLGAKKCATGTQAQPNYTPAYFYIRPVLCESDHFVVLSRFVKSQKFVICSEDKTRHLPYVLKVAFYQVSDLKQKGETKIPPIIYMIIRESFKGKSFREKMVEFTKVTLKILLLPQMIHRFLITLMQTGSTCMLMSILSLALLPS